MKVVQYARRGHPPDVVEVVDLETGAPQADEVVIAVEASPINPSDLLTLSGEYGVLPPLPAIAGNEGVGRVTAAGAEVANVKVGDRVFLPLGAGAWRQELRAPAAGLEPLPAEGDPLQLAMAMINPPTAYLMLHRMVELSAGDWLIQNAANSGVGRYLIELAALAGIRTVNLVRREGAVAALEALGADAVVVAGDDLAQRVAEATGGAKIRLALDAIGGDATMALAGCLARGGTVVNYGLLSGKACKLSPEHTIFKDIRLRGFWLANWFRDSGPEERAALYRELVALLLEGKLGTEVEATYAIERVREALAHAMAEGRSGKILLTPGTAP
jgi:NADPH:quinone reductase-like Zn-dependent oxidoreductase